MTQTSIALMWVVLVQSFLWQNKIRAIKSVIKEPWKFSQCHQRAVTELSQSRHSCKWAVIGPSKGHQRAIKGPSKGPSKSHYKVVTALSQGHHRAATGQSHCLHNYLAPLKSEINERNDVMLKAIRPGTISDGINTEDAETTLNIILGIKVCKKWFVNGRLSK